MSRTYRRGMIELDKNHKHYKYKRYRYDVWEVEYWEHQPYSYFEKWNLRRDMKPWYKPPKVAKTVYKRLRRAKVRNAMRQGKYDYLPMFKKQDIWEWT